MPRKPAKQPPIVGSQTSVTVTPKAIRSPEEVVKGLTDVKLRLTETLDSVASQVLSGYGELKGVQEALNQAKEKLQAVHEIDAEAVTALELAETIAEAKAEWDEKEAQRQQTRAREEEEYQYNLKIKRRADDDKRNAEIAKDRANNDAEFAAQKRDIESRLSVLEAREDEVKALQAEVNTFSDRLKSAVTQAEAIVRNSVKRELEHAFAVEKLGLQHAVQTAGQLNSSLEAQLTKLTKENEALQVKVDTANNRVQEIASKAIDGAAQAKVTVQSVASESQPARR